MIKVDRSQADIPECLRKDIRSVGIRETERAILHFEDPLVESKFTFSAYAHAEVKRALKILFNNKCGFCEIDYGGAASDVEHFRPKGRLDKLRDDGCVVAIGNGYYWLGAEWENLIYSCQHCNRGETHLHEGDIAGIYAFREVSGKRNLFPLSDDAYRATRAAGIEDEDPFRLLLNPCLDDPSLHLEFDRNGHVIPKKVGDDVSLQGRVSIDVYGLRREPLSKRRKRVAKGLMYTIGVLNRSVERLLLNVECEYARSDIEESISQISEDFLAPECPFLALSRQLVARHIDFAKLRTACDLAALEHL